MPEVNRTAAGKVTPPASTDPVESAATGEDVPQYVTKSDLEALMNKVSSDYKAEIGRLRKALKSEPVKAVEDEAPSDPAEAGDGKQGWHKMVSSKLQEVERREAIAQKGARRSQIRNALVNAGADPSLADLVVPAVLESEGEGFKVSLNEQTGEYTVAYQDGNLADWAKAYLLTEQGKRVAAPKSVPSMTGVPGRPGTVAGLRQVPASQASMLSDEELRSGLVQIVAG